MSTRDVFSRGILLGPYSRFHFFHPGPLYFLIRYPFYMAMGQSNASFFIVTALIGASCLFGAWYVVRKLTNRLTSILFSAVFALFLLNTDKAIWLSEWNPHIIIFPVMLYAVVMAAVGSRETRYLYLAVLAGSFVAQTHIAGVPSLTICAMIALLCAIYPWMITSTGCKRDRTYLNHILISLALLLLLWAPPIYEEITSDSQGNLTTIRKFFEETHSDQNTDIAVETWSNILTGFELGEFARPLRENGLSDTASTVVIALRLLFLAAGFSLLRRRGKSGFLCALCLVCLLLHGAAYYSISQIRGELHPYLVEWMKVIAPLSVFAILASVFALIRGIGRAEAFRKYSGLSLAVFIVYASVALLIEVSGFFRAELHHSRETDIAVQVLSAQLSDYIDQQLDYFYVLKIHSTNCWPVMVGLMNSLEKQGYPICMEDNEWFVSTPPPCGIVTRILHIGNLNEVGENMPGLIGHYDDLGIILL
jgi:hypothetical protein